MILKIGTRASRLALWQTQYIVNLLEGAGLKTEIKTIKTKGDKILNKPLAAIGSKGLFTAELEEALLNRQIDLAVHSAKDLPTAFPPNLKIIAFTKRHRANDVLVSLNKNLDLTKPLKIGTSSNRRIAQIRQYYPHFTCRSIRGNLPTRLKRLESDLYDALILARAGVERLGYTDLIVQELDLDKFVPAVGQGSIAIQIGKQSQTFEDKLRQVLNHHESEQEILAERRFLKILEGGCSIPIFAKATFKKPYLEIEGGIADFEGGYLQVKHRGDLRLISAEEIGDQLAQTILQKGKSIIENWR